MFQNARTCNLLYILHVSYSSKALEGLQHYWNNSYGLLQTWSIGLLVSHCLQAAGIILLHVRAVGEMREVCYQDTGTCDVVSFGMLRPLVR